MRTKVLLVSLIISMLLLSCGGGDGNSSRNETQSRAYSISLSDDWLNGADVKDSNNQKATYRGKGVYVFKSKPKGTITLKGGIFENSNVKNKMTMKVDANSKHLSPVASFFYEYPNLKEKILSAFNTDDIDYTKTKNIALFKTSKIIYIMSINNLKNEFANSLEGDIKNYNDVMKVARDISKTSPRADIINANLAAITLSYFDIEDSSIISKIVEDKEFSILSTSPTNNDKDIPTNTQLSVKFSKKLKTSNLKENIVLKETQSKTKIDADISANDSVIYIIPKQTLKENTSYTLDLSKSIQSIDGESLSIPISISFTTSNDTDKTKPKVDSIYPKNGAKIDYGEKATITFDEAIDKNSIANGIKVFKLVSTNSNEVKLSFTLSNSDKTVTIDNFLDDDSNYKLEVNTNTTDLAGNNLEKNYNIDFTVNKDTTPPKLLSVSPKDGDTGVSTDTGVAVKFNEPIDKWPAESSTNGIQITRASDNKEYGRDFTFLDEHNTTILLKPYSLLSDNSSFIITIPDSIKDINGITLGKSEKITFTTGLLDSKPPEIVNVKGIDSSTNASIDLENATIKSKGDDIKIQFNEKIDLTDVKLDEFVKIKSNSTPVSSPSPSYIELKENCAGTPNCITSYLSVDDNKTYIIGLELNSGNYTLEINPIAKDLAGNKMTFTTQTYNFKAERK